MKGKGESLTKVGGGGGGEKGELDPLLLISLRFRVFSLPQQLTLTGNIIISGEGKLLGQIEDAKTQEDGRVLPPHRNACPLARKNSGT